MIRKMKPSQEDPVEEFYDWLNEYLEDSDGLSAAALADAVGVSRQYIYDLKKRRAVPSGYVMHKLAIAMGGRLIVERPEKFCRV